LLLSQRLLQTGGLSQDVDDRDVPVIYFHALSWDLRQTTWTFSVYPHQTSRLFDWLARCDVIALATRGRSVRDDVIVCRHKRVDRVQRACVLRQSLMGLTESGSMVRRLTAIMTVSSSKRRPQDEMHGERVINVRSQCWCIHLQPPVLKSRGHSESMKKKNEL